MSNIVIYLSTLILQPARDVFEYIANPENNSQWQYGSLESVQISKGDMDIGTVFSSFGHFMGRRIQSTFEVTEFEPNRRFGFKTLSGPIQLHSSYKFDATDSGTYVIVSTQVNPGRFFKLMNPIVARAAKKQFTENLVTLKQILESKDPKHKR